MDRLSRGCKTAGKHHRHSSSSDSEDLTRRKRTNDIPYTQEDRRAPVFPTYTSDNPDKTEMDRPNRGPRTKAKHHRHSSSSDSDDIPARKPTNDNPFSQEERHMPKSATAKSEKLDKPPRDCPDTIHTWESVLSRVYDVDERNLKHLLEAGILPVQTEVQKAYELHRQHRLTKKTFDDICQTICDYIQATSDRISLVRPYRTAQDPEEIVFVAMADAEVTINTEIVYDVKVCHPNGYSEEGTVITYHDLRKNKQITPEESEHITKIIQEQSDKLFKEHSNIQMISGCSVKSRRFGTDSFTIGLQTCIVIYVNVKGVIPLHETSLPDHLPIPDTNLSLPVDVREGGVCSFGTPNEYHQNLKMGLQVTDLTTVGTLGPILKYEEKTFCLTCAHVFFDNPNQNFIDSIRASDKYTKADNDTTTGIQVYQSSNTPPFGVVQQAAFLSGDKHYAGIDVAVIEVTDPTRLPTDGSFPDGNMDATGFDPDSPMVYCSGMIYDEVTFREQTKHHREVVKYGSVTEYTRGSLDVQGLAVKRNDFPANFRLQKTMYNQLAVLSVGDPSVNPFAKAGDSGALVLTQHGGHWNDLRAVGIVEGGTSNKMVIVTPIWDVFKHLQIPTEHGLMRFNSPSFMRIDSGIVVNNDSMPPTPAETAAVGYERDQEMHQEMAKHFREAKVDQQREMRELEERQNSRLERIRQEQNDSMRRLHSNVQQDIKGVNEAVKQQQEATNQIDSKMSMMMEMLQKLTEKK